jgi:hypothetical protein
MSDLIQRLRDCETPEHDPNLPDECADALEAQGREIERLRADNKRLIEAQSSEGRHALRINNERLRAALEKIANSLPSGVYSYATDIAIAALAGQPDAATDSPPTPAAP